MQGLSADRLLNYLPLALALLVAVLVVLLLSSGSFSAGEETASPPEPRAVKLTDSLLDGLPQRGSALGRPGAPVTLQFFGDLQCRESRQVMLGALPFLIRHWVRDGQLRILFRATKVDTPDWPEFREQQIAALAAGPQGKMWTFIDLFYREQRAERSRYADDAFLEGIAEQAGLELGVWAEARESDAWAGSIESDEVLAQAKEMESTPSFLIGPTGGPAHRLRHFSFGDPKTFDEAIRELLS